MLPLVIVCVIKEKAVLELVSVPSVYILAEVLLEEVTTIWCHLSSLIISVAILVFVTPQSDNWTLLVTQKLEGQKIANANVLVPVRLDIILYWSVQADADVVLIRACADRGLDAVFRLNDGNLILDAEARTNKAHWFFFQFDTQ